MRTQASLFIALSLLACFVTADTNCSSLELKDECAASNTACTWTDDSTKNKCTYLCPTSPKTQKECTDFAGCTYGASTCQQTTTCTGLKQDACTAQVNCQFAAATCKVSAGANTVCTDAQNACKNPLPANCLQATTQGCTSVTPATSTCPQGVSNANQCTGPCTAGNPITTCTASICDNLGQDDCQNNQTCLWGTNSCGLAAGQTACNTPNLDCTKNNQCVSVTVYNCSASTDSIAQFCTPNPTGSACSTGQAGWCQTTNTQTCSLNTNYCTLGQGNGCADTTNCTTTEDTCSILNADACTLTADKPNCDTTLCTSTPATCNNSAKGCTVNGPACAPADASCTFVAGGSCAVKSSDTRGYIIAACASILAFVFAF